MKFLLFLIFFTSINASDMNSNSGERNIDFEHSIERTASSWSGCEYACVAAYDRAQAFAKKLCRSNKEQIDDRYRYNCEYLNVFWTYCKAEIHLDYNCLGITKYDNKSNNK